VAKVTSITTTTTPTVTEALMNSEHQVCFNIRMNNWPAVRNYVYIYILLGYNVNKSYTQCW